MITSSHLCTASFATQYELSTRKPPHLRPIRSSAMLQRLRVLCYTLVPWLTIDSTLGNAFLAVVALDADT
jgi:hypothetical protein